MSERSQAYYRCQEAAYGSAASLPHNRLQLPTGWPHAVHDGAEAQLGPDAQHARSHGNNELPRAHANPFEAVQGPAEGQLDTGLWERYTSPREPGQQQRHASSAVRSLGPVTSGSTHAKGHSDRAPLSVQHVDTPCSAAEIYESCLCAQVQRSSKI